MEIEIPESQRKVLSWQRQDLVSERTRIDDLTHDLEKE